MSQRIFRENYDFFNGLRQDGRVTMLTGRLLADGSVTTAGAPTNKTFVRSTYSSREQTAVRGVISTANVPVIVDYNSENELEIVGVNWTLGTLMFGDALPTVAAPPTNNELLPTTVSESGILPGRLQYSKLGGTYLHVTGFENNGTRYQPTLDANGNETGTDDTDVTAFFPAGTDEYGMIGCYYNPSTAALVYFAGEHDHDPGQFAYTDRASVPAGCIPIGAARVQNGKDITRANGIPFYSWRNFLSPNGYLLSGDAVTRTIASGVLTVGDESVVIVAAESGTSDTVQRIVLTGLARKLVLMADAGDTITFAQYVSGTDNVYLFGGIDIPITGKQLLEGWHDATDFRGGAGGGASVFTDLTDAPASYAGAGDQVVFVNTGATGLEFRDAMPVASKTRMVGTVLWDLTLSGTGSFDTNSADDYGHSGAFGTDYAWIEVFWKLRGAAATTGVAIRIAFNNDTTATNYQTQFDYKGSSDGQGLADNSRDFNVCAADTATANYYGSGRAIINNPGAAIYKSMICKGDDPRSSSSHSVNDNDTQWRNTAPITRLAVDVNNATTTFVAGSRLIVVGYKQEPIGGIAYSTANVSNPPTDVELDSAFGAPATLPVPFSAIVNDNGGGTNEYLVWSDGTNWFYATGTLAT